MAKEILTKEQLKEKQEKSKNQYEKCVMQMYDNFDYLKKREFFNFYLKVYIEITWAERMGYEQEN